MGCAHSTPGGGEQEAHTERPQPQVKLQPVVTPKQQVSAGTTNGRSDGRAYQLDSSNSMKQGGIGSPHQQARNGIPAGRDPAARSTSSSSTSTAPSVQPVLQQQPAAQPAQAAPSPASVPTSRSQAQHAMASAAQDARRAGEQGPKGRRAAAGTDALREQVRKMAVGSGQDAVSDSEDDELNEQEAPRHAGTGKSPEVSDAICEALKKNFVFKGINSSLLAQVVDRMYGVRFSAGQTVLQQGAVPKTDDCMYFLQQGEAEVVITGAVDQNATKPQGSGEERKVEGHTVRILQKPGWVFGDVAILFHSPRTASVVAKTDIVVWALDRRTFLQFVMKHAVGARALRFLRKLPLLKGLSDNDLIRAASRMPQRTYNDGQPLVTYGERGDELFLIRYGKVRVLRPDGDDPNKRIEAVVLGRGQFVGERAVINDRLRSADCVAKGDVTVVVMKKRDFMDLDNPLLAWMLDYDAVSACLRPLMAPGGLLRGLKQEALEQLLDRFDQREQVLQGQTIINQGDLVDKLYVCKIGEVVLLRDDQPISDPSFVKESGGFTYFGDEALAQPMRSKYTVKVSSETLHMLSLPKQKLDAFLGRDNGLVASTEQIVSALKHSKHLAGLTESELMQLVTKYAEEVQYSASDVIAVANGPVTNKVFLVKSGEVVLVPADVPLPGQVELTTRGAERRLVPGQLYNDEAVAAPDAASLKFSLVASAPNTTLITFTTNDIERVAGQKLVGMAHRSASGAALGGNSTGHQVGVVSSRLRSINFHELEYHRIVGTGQFGLVRLVRNTRTGEVYALKVMHKAPITETKQIEHVLNERRILEEASHPFCVKLLGAYQDRNSLYLLQEWVPGGELFHHLDIEGAFDEPTAQFFAASVLLALEFLHSKNMVYRDLKPENLLLDAQGYIKVADFGFAKFIGDDKTYTICGTPDYQAPEVIMRRGTTKAADYWALGVLIFEMLVGDPPFKSLTGDPWDTFRRTLSGRFYVPNFISDGAADLIFKLLQVNPERRLGSGPGGAQEIRSHRWFQNFDWAALEKRMLKAPIQPKVRNPLDTSNFDNFDSCDVEAPPVPENRLQKHAQLWDMWDWIERPTAGSAAAAASSSQHAAPSHSPSMR